jgi:hypothetical protein
MDITKETLAFLYSLLMNVQLSASADNFDDVAAHVSTAKRELQGALSAEMEGS